MTETTKEASFHVDTEASTGKEVLEVVHKENELSSRPAVPVALADEASRATAVDHKLPVADEHTVQANVAAAEPEPKIADKATIVEATNAGEKLGQTPEKENRPEEPIAQSKALLTVDQDVESLVPENFDRHEHSSSASTERDKTVSLAESEDFLPEGIPDPVASLAGFFEEHGSSQRALQSTELHYTTSDGLQKRHNINIAIEPPKEQDHLSELSKEYKAQTDVNGKEDVTSGAECWQSPPEVAEEDALLEGEGVTPQHPSILKGCEDTEEVLNTGGRHTGGTEPKPSTEEKDGAIACTELAENKPHSFTNGQSADGADGWHSPPGVREDDALPRDKNKEDGKNEALKRALYVLPKEEENPVAEVVPSAVGTKPSPRENDEHLTGVSIQKPPPANDHSVVVAEGYLESPPGVAEEQAVPEDASAVSPEHNKQQKGVEGFVNVLPIEEEKHITEKVFNASEANTSIGENDVKLQSTEVAERKPSTSATKEKEGWQSPPGVTEEQAVSSSPEVAEKDPILEDANDVSGTAKVLDIEEQKRITEVLPSTVKTKSLSGENDVGLTNMAMLEQKPPPKSDQSLVGVEGWQSPRGGTKQQALPEDASAVSHDRDKQQGGVEGSAKLLPNEQEHIDQIPSSAAEASTSVGEKDVKSQSPEPSTEERKVEGWHSPPEVTEEQATLEDASVVSGTVEVLRTEEQKPIAEALHSAAETKSSRGENDANLPSTEVSEWKGPPSASTESLVRAEGTQSPPGVTEQHALPNPSAVSPQRGIQEGGVEGFAEVPHIEEERRINEVPLNAAEASMSIGDKSVKMQNTELSVNKPSLSTNDQSLKGVERRQSAPVLTEQNAVSEDTSAASPAHGKEERPEGTAPELHIEEEKHTLEKPLSTAVERLFTAEKSADFQSAETSERKPFPSANDQSMCRAVDSQSLPGAPKEEAHTVDVRAVSAEDGKQERVEGNGEVLDTREENDTTVALPSAVPGEKCGEASSTELAVHKPCSGRVESTVVVDGWQSPSAVIGEDALPEDENVSHDLQLRSLSSEQCEGEKVATVTESMTYQRVVGELKETQSLSRQLKRKAKARREHDGAKPEARTFKFNTQSGTSDNLCMLDNLNRGFMSTTIKSASSSTGSALCRREKTDVTDEEVVYSSSGSNSPCGQLTSVKKSSSCCLVIVDYEDEESSPTTFRPRPASPVRHYLDFTANFQQGQVVPYTGDVQKLRAPSKITNFLTSNISSKDDEDSSPSRRSDKRARRAKQEAHARESCDESTYPSCPNVPSKSSENCDSDSSTSRLPGTDYSYSATSAPKISPPHHDSKVQSLLCCKLCGQSFFRSDPTHAELCSSYHRDAALPAATSGVPPTAQFLEKYVLSVVDEDDVSDVLRQAWRDEETAILASSVWTLYRCVPSAFYIIREKERRPTSRGDVCASACVITFGDEVSFCGFFHVSRERANEGLSRMLWTRMLEACQGKNVCTVMPQERAQPFLDRYHFHVSYWGDIVYCHVTLRRDSFPARSGSNVGVLVRDFDLKRDAEAVIEYDRGVFGFDRSYYLHVALAEEEQMVKVSTATSSEGHVKVVGYAGIQTDQRGRPALRWLLADGDEVAQALMHAVVEACPKIREKGLVGVFYAASHATGVILNNVDKDFIEPWALLYNKREPFFRYDKIVSLTHI
ncbi:hypothetical protein HPB50_006382 [Hyalomma asiaticum]|uniref:Uncharacterized protein n=1 Tax=Hyalomma asiaticum TaxID=266040 RepID=A0ACB7ST31_HYAAI|nr:hypothetical protein HPB50_006382 [Hyalomma asiaticum]